MLTVNITVIIALCGVALAFGTFLFTMFRWVTNIIKEATSAVKAELLMLRTNDLAHIYSEIQELRKEKHNA